MFHRTDRPDRTDRPTGADRPIGTDRPDRPDRPDRRDRPNRLRVRLTLLLLVPGLAGCDPFGGDDILTLEVAEVRLPCIGLIPQECLLVRSRPTQEFGLFYSGIEGFDYESGYRYLVRVSRHRLRNPPADGSSIEYRLIRIESRDPSPRGDLLAEAAEAESRWHATWPVAYSMELERGCFCHPDGMGPVRLEATREFGGEVWPYEAITSLHYVADDREVPASFAPFFLSVQGLFSYLRIAIVSDAHHIEAEFDATAGYPRRVYVDWFQNVSDDEVDYIVHSLTPES